MPGRSPTSTCQKFWMPAMPGRVWVAPYRRGWCDGANTSPTMRTVTSAVPVSTVVRSPMARPLASRNEVFTSTSPGASYQWPAMRA